MPTIADNIKAMAGLVAETKKTYHLTEATVLRIVDMNFALAQGAGQPTFGGDEQMPWDALPPDPNAPTEGEEGADVNTGQIVMFSDNELNVTPDGDEEELIATTERKPN